MSTPLLEAPVDFKEWLDNSEGEYGTLLKYLTPAPNEYEFKTYVALVPDEYLDLFLNAEAAWKTETAAHRTAVAALVPPPDPTELVRKFAPNCVYRHRTGRLCGRAVVPGVDRCVKHGGALIDPEVRRHILMSSYATIVEGSYKAVEALLDVAENGRSEMARVQAAKELLDRAGLSAEINLNVRISAEMDAGSILRERLNSMSEKLDLFNVIDVTEVEPEELPGIEGTEAVPTPIDESLLDEDSLLHSSESGQEEE